MGEVADKEGEEEEGDKKTDLITRRWEGILLARVWLACELGVFVERCVECVILTIHVCGEYICKSIDFNVFLSSVLLNVNWTYLSPAVKDGDVEELFQKRVAYLF